MLWVYLETITAVFCYRLPRVKSALPSVQGGFQTTIHCFAGKPELNYDAAKGPVRAPWIAWGPYLWADGMKASKSGLSYAREDYRADDGTHPAESGRMKVAVRLLEFLKADATSRGWFAGKG